MLAEQIYGENSFIQTNDPNTVWPPGPNVRTVAFTINYQERNNVLFRRICFSAKQVECVHGLCGGYLLSKLQIQHIS